MTSLRVFLARLTGLFSASRHDAALVEDMETHLALLADEYRGRGLSDRDARLAAHKAFGGVERTRHAVHDLRSFVWLEEAAQDVRYAARTLRRTPLFSATAVLTLALGVGATTSLFSLAYGVLMRPLPWPNSDRIVVLKESRGGNAPRFGAFTSAAYLAWRSGSATIEHMAAWSQRLVTLTEVGEPERIRVITATAGLFPVLGARPLRGSLYEEKDETSPVAVVSERLWRQRFNADPAAIGRPIRLDGQSYTVVGVLPDNFAYPDRDTLVVVPMVVQPANGGLSIFEAMALLRPGVTGEQAMAEGTARGRLVPDTGLATIAVFGSSGPVKVETQSLRDAMTGDVRRPLIVLLVAVGLLLATATANVASLQLARTTTRHRELAIRAALGAGSGRLARQLFVESLLLGLMGSVAGLAVTLLLHRFIPSLLPADFPRLDGLRADATVLVMALVVSVGTSLVLGLLPASRGRRLDLVEVMAEDGMAPVGAAGSRVARSRVLIMAAQVAIACVLLVGASLLGRSFYRAMNADRGYDVTDVLSGRLSMPEAMYPAAERRFAIVDEVLARIARNPGVIEAAFTSELPLSIGGSTSAFELRSRTAGIVTAQASPRIVSRRYFAALKIGTTEGRTLSEFDTETSEPVVIVNRAFARRYLGDSALGSRVPIAGYAPPDGDQVESTVVGVVDDVRYITSSAVTQPELYYSYEQMGGRLPVQTVTLLVRTAGDFAAAAAALKAAVRETDSRLAIDRVVPLAQRLATTLDRPRLYAVLLGGFAAFALVIATAGLFGLMSYAVSLRSRELAIRSALGARRTEILRLIMRQGVAVTLAGLLGGLFTSGLLAGTLSTQLYGVAPHDAATFVAVPTLLATVSLLACLMAARRAARQEGLGVLRNW